MATQRCPCGLLGDASRSCRCTSEQIQRYRARISGPLLDRIDLHVEVPRPRQPAAEAAAQVTRASMAARVNFARERQLERSGVPNAWLKPKVIDQVCRLGAAELGMLNTAIQRFGLSERARHRVLKVARTIADLAADDQIRTTHLSEAVGFRVLDRNAENC